MSRRVVWILGAGFSMPLGGPSLASLLSWETERYLSELLAADPDTATYADNLMGSVAQCTRYLYQYGTRFAGSGGRGLQHEVGEWLWSDAEDFFDKLDRAARSPEGTSARRFVAIIRRSPHGKVLSIVAMRDAAKRMLAYECARFLDDQDTSHETWLPYKKWKRQLVAESANEATSQTVITFNYDCVLETLGLQSNVSLPGDDHERKNLRVLKLHGSTNWRHKPDDSLVTEDGDALITEDGSELVVANDHVELAGDAHFAAKCKPWELAIAAPGPSKQEQAGRFRDLWELAGAALKTAGAVVFLGYRVPPTDARSRRFLLENLPHGTYPIHLVLGHDTSNPDVRRLHGLLSMARPNASVSALPMFGQDYIDAWDPTRW